MPIDKRGLDGICKDIYGTDGAAQLDRFEELVAMHREVFGSDAREFYSSPGRIEMIGNHTDHNGGKVLCAAINVDTLAAVSKREDGVIEVKSKGYPMLRVDCAAPVFSVSEIGTSTALIKGVVDYFARSGKRVGGFCACMTSSVPKGSGVSSSSSFELVIAEILNVMYNDGELSPIFKAKASQYAENTYFGKPSGLMDQSAIALGGVNMIDFADLEEPAVKKADWKFDLDIFVIATGGDHSNLTDDYAAIPLEMRSVASKFGAKLLHEISPEKWEAEKESVRPLVEPRAFLRAEHFFEENARVERAVAMIDEGDKEGFLSLVNESGLSSRYKLQNTYSPACQNHNLENALDSVKRIDGVLAYRVHGGGFAGTILTFADPAASGVHNALNVMFGEENVFKLAIRDSGACKLLI